jgi:hypothetical protein
MKYFDQSEKKKFKNKLKDDSTTDPNTPILQISDVEIVLFLIKAFPQVIRYKEDKVEYTNI